MSSQPPRRQRITVEDVGDVTVVHFLDKKLLDEQNIQMVGDDLYRLVDELGRTNVLLNFANVEFMSSTATGKIIRLHQRLTTARGRLMLCNLAGDIADVFALTKLNRMLTIVRDEPTALQSFSGSTTRVVCPLPGCPGRLSFPPGESATVTEMCPACRAVVEYLPLVAPPACRVRSVRCTTYPGEWVRGEVVFTADRQASFGWRVEVFGRLDLFASEELERVWRTIPEPRRVAADLSAVTEVSAAGGEVLAGLLTTAEGVLFTPPAGGLPAGVTLPEHVTPSANTDPVEWLGGHGPAPALTVPVTLER